MTVWRPGYWRVSQLTDAELRKGITRCQAELAELEDDAPIRAGVAGQLAQYQKELATRLHNRRGPLPSSVSQRRPEK